VVGTGAPPGGGPIELESTYNVALGYNNLQNNTTGVFNVALGDSALFQIQPEMKTLL
jgi:hypothetical protein